MVRILAALMMLMLPQDADAIEADVGVIADLAGSVVLERGGKNYRLSIGVPLYAQDRLTTRATGKVRVLLKDNSVVSIGPKSSIELSSLAIDQERSFVLDVLFGRFKMDVASWFRGPTRGTVKTPTAVAGVRGTVLWGDTELDAVCALEGSIQLTSRTGDQDGVTLEATDKGVDCAAGMKDGNTDTIKPTAEDLMNFLDEFKIP